MAEAYWNIGLSHHFAKRYKEAVEAYGEYARVKPSAGTEFQFHHNFGIAFAGLGQFPQAIDAYKRAIAVKPDDSESHYLVGGAYYGSRRFAEAVNSLSRATEIKPDYVPYELALGKAYFSLGNREAALRQHTKLKTLDSEAANELVKIMDGKTQ